jgi:hypothetical protein
MDNQNINFAKCTSCLLKKEYSFVTVEELLSNNPNNLEEKKISNYFVNSSRKKLRQKK